MAKRGRDVGLRKTALVYRARDNKRTIVEKDSKEFLFKFVERMEKKLLEDTKDKIDRRQNASSPREIAEAGVEYIRACLTLDQPLTLSGMALFMGFGRRFLSQKLNDEYFHDVITKLSTFVEMYNESALHIRQNPVGAIFVLKNMGWSDNMDVTLRPAPSMSLEERMAAKKRISEFSE